MRCHRSRKPTRIKEAGARVGSRGARMEAIGRLAVDPAGYSIGRRRCTAFTGAGQGVTLGRPALFPRCPHGCSPAALTGGISLLTGALAVIWAEIKASEVRQQEALKAMEARQREDMKASEVRQQEVLKAMEARQREDMKASEVRQQEVLKAMEARQREEMREMREYMKAGEARQREEMREMREYLKAGEARQREEMREYLKASEARQQEALKAMEARQREDMKISEARQREEMRETRADTKALGENVDRLMESMMTVRK